jgi:hypothetical protein
MPLAVRHGRNTCIELGKKEDLTGALHHYDQAAKTDATNVVYQLTVRRSDDSPP